MQVTQLKGEQSEQINLLFFFFSFFTPSQPHGLHQDENQSPNITAQNKLNEFMKSSLDPTRQMNL